MKKPVLDPRSREDIMAQLAAHAREYTPEWRYEGAADDPGAALADLFGEMFYQTVDRINSVPEKLHTEFLNLTGFRMPDPIPAEGLFQFTAHDTVDKPVPVPKGTQLFTEDGEGNNVVYETERLIESTPAALQSLYYVDPADGTVRRLDRSRTQPFFTPGEGEDLQCHRFSVGQDDVLALSGPCTVVAEVRQKAGFTAVETAQRLAEEGRWSFRGEKGEVPFTGARAENGSIFLTYDGEEAFAPGEDGRYAITCEGSFGSGQIVLEGMTLRSSPADWLEVDSAANGDIPLDMEEGGYCFGRRPAPYELCYFRSDRVFRKRGARANLTLEIAPIITDLTDDGPQYSFHERVIDKRDAVVIVPDDVYVAEVIWEYNNGAGWRKLAVRGDKNPFSCKKEGELSLTFDIPADMTAVEVNAEEGYYIRARVLHVENQFTTRPRWIVPFLKRAVCTWAYGEGQPIRWCRSRNNGSAVDMEDVEQTRELGFLAYEGLSEAPRAMYLSFDRSPDGMPLSLYFDVAGRVNLGDTLRVEAWTGQRFESVRTVDTTRNLLHPGVMLLYLPRPLPEGDFFGETGCWLRLVRSSYLESAGGYPRVRGIYPNIVSGCQRETGEEMRFSVGPYEANKEVALFYSPVLELEVWVDEQSGLAVADARELAGRLGDRVRLEWDDRVLKHCWVRWDRAYALALAGPEDRSYSLDPYGAVITFGDGVHGRVPPAGDNVILVRYRYGGGSRGNCPAGAVTRLIGALPRISRVENLTPMSGGTDRFSAEKADAIGSRQLRHRFRAAGVRDFEEIVLQRFPQVRHVKCFSGRNERGHYVPGHVSVVVEGSDLDDRRVIDDLCQHIYEELSRLCDCVMTAENRLHVVGSTVITVGSYLTVEMEDPDRSADTQQELTRRLEALIDGKWREREIGSQLRIAQVWQTVRDTPNVRAIRSILLEGRYDDAGVQRVVPLEDDDAFPFATVKSGRHQIEIG